MTPARFLEKFELIAETSGAMEKMRALVRRLAIHGQLVECRINDGYATTIFARNPPSPTQGRHEVAKNWLWVPFASVGEQRLGKMLDQKGNRGEPKPYLRNTNVQWMRFELSDVKELRLEVNELDEYRLMPGDLLICEGGEPGRCAIWRDNHREMYFQKAIHRVRPRKGILPEYLAICLKADAESGVLADYFTGATIKHLTGRSLREYSIPLPPFAEQKRIIAKVDELMALCDRLEAQQKERETRLTALARASLSRFADAPTPANLTFLFHKSYTVSPAGLRKSVLTLALKGKLIPQDHRDEPAQRIIERIDEQKRAMVEKGTFRQAKVARPQSAFDAPTHLPTAWQWVNVDTLCFKVTDGTHFTPRYVEAGVRFVSAKDIVSGRLSFDRCKFISQEEHDRLYRRCNPEYHDIVISKSGSIGAVALVEDQDEFSLFESLALLKFDQDSIAPDFLVYALTDACASLTSGHIRGVGVKHLHLDMLRGLELGLPPLAEQRRIVTKVDQLMALVDDLETQLAASRSTAAKLLDAIVGELTG